MKKKKLNVTSLLKAEVKKTSLNATAKKLKVGSHNTIKRWTENGVPLHVQAHVLKHLGA